MDKSKLQKIKTGDLYALLSVCSKEELDTIVEVLLDQSTSSLQEQDAYKENSPDHTKYHTLIGDELCAFGGNTFANLKRGGKGVSYHEIVYDVCKRLKIPCNKNQTVDNEKAILRLYELEAEKVDKNKFNIKGEVLKGILPRLAFGPAGWLSIPLQAAGPAYRVTVPCVQLIAELRINKIKELESQVIRTVNNANAVDFNDEVTAENYLTITNEDNELVMSLMQVPELESRSWNSVSENGDEISWLSPFLQVVPGLAIASEVSNAKYMEVVINGPLVDAATGEGAYRGWSVGIDGKISEQANLFEADTLSNLVNASALFQVASVAVAQKHLADISQKLSEIKAVVEEISEYQKTERESKILASIKYFEEKAEPIILYGELSNAVLNEIETSERDMLAIQTHLLSDIKNINNNIGLQNKSKIGSQKLVDEIESKQSDIQGLYNQLLLCIRARACGWQLLSLYPNNEGLVKSRKQKLKEEVDKLQTGGELLKATENSLIQEIKAISSNLKSDTKINEHKLKLLDKNQQLFNSINTEKLKVEQEIEQAESFVKELKEPSAKILVKVDNDKIVATSMT